LICMCIVVEGEGKLGISRPVLSTAQPSLREQGFII